MTMNQELLEKAKQLSFQNYALKMEEDVLSDGSPIFLASNPELQGCKSQGRTIDEAVFNLAEARIDYIYSLLEDDLPVPEPVIVNTSTGTFPDAVATYVREFTIEYPDDFEQVLATVFQPESRVPLYTALVQA
jgi:predicted RNase H-like HicB family nuclease